MQQRIAVVLVSSVALFASSSTARTQSPDPMIGTWKGNLAKSTYSPDPKPTVATTRTIESAAGGLFKATVDGMTTEGHPVHTETVFGFDGKDYPIKGAPAPNTTAAYRRIDSRTFEVTSKVDGKLTTLTTLVVISADGKTMTSTQTGTNSQGQTVKNVVVAVKQ